MKNSCCFNCDKRNENCHSECQDYKAEFAKNLKRRDDQLKEKEAEIYYASLSNKTREHYSRSAKKRIKLSRWR